MARIIKAILGPDGKVRVVELKTATGVTKRAVSRISPLPIDNRDQNIETNSASEEPSVSNSVLKRAAEGTTETKTAKIGYSSKKPKHGLLTTLCVIGCFLPSSLTQNFNVTQLQDSGAYFEKIGKVGIVSSAFNFMIYYDLENY